MKAKQRLRALEQRTAPECRLVIKVAWTEAEAAELAAQAERTGDTLILIRYEDETGTEPTEPA